MSLTAGSTLQNGKYLIQTLLHQSDADVSYQATHTILNQPVVIQTLNSSLRQSPRFEMLRQQFLATVRQSTGPVIVRDCFEEDEMPYVVVEPIAGRFPIKLSEWMPFLKAALLQPVPSSNGSVSPALQLPVLPASAPVLEAAQAEGSELPAATSPAETVAPEPTASRSRRWLPIALALTAIGASLGGAAFGWSLRRSASSPSTPALFSREQSFPQKTDWLGEDPYSEEEYSSDSASPAIERRSVVPRRERGETREFEPRRREREETREFEPRRRRVRPERADIPAPRPEAEEEPLIEAPSGKIEPEAIPQVEAPPVAEPLAAPEAPVDLPSPKTRSIPVVPAPEPPVAIPPAADPISQ